MWLRPPAAVYQGLRLHIELIDTRSTLSGCFLLAPGDLELAEGREALLIH